MSAADPTTQPAVPLTGVIRLRRAGHVRGAVAAPASKSMTIRLAVVAALAEGRSVLTAPLVATDTAAVRGAVEALGARVTDVGGADGAPAWAVDGTGGRFTTPAAPIDCRLSGTTLRLVTAVATHAPGAVTVTGAPALRARPVGPLTGCLRDLGADVVDAGGHPPVTLRGGGLAGGSTVVDVSASSQYASALLLAAPLARRPVTITAVGQAADAYIGLTVDALRDAGVTVDPVAPRTWRVRPGLPRPRTVTVEHDASAACHLYALAVATGGAVTVSNAGPTQQPDARILDVLAAMGAQVQRGSATVTVTGPDRPRPVDVDLSTAPDQVTTVAALAALADGVSHIRGVGVTRGHETDRPAALATELRMLGATVFEDVDALQVDGRGVLDGRGKTQVTLGTYGDHRLAMAFAAIAARIPGVGVADPGVVAKTYPQFWTDIATLGLAPESAS